MPEFSNLLPTRAQRRRIAREAAKQLMRSIGTGNRPPESGSELDVGWFLAAFMALGLYLLAPKIGRLLTAIVLVAMAGCLINPIWRLRFVQASPTATQKGWRFAELMTVAFLCVVFLGVYVWPPIKRHVLNRNELTLFENALKAQKDDDLEIQIACSPNDEKVCTYAGQFIRPIGDSGWKVQAYVSRLMLTRPLDGVMIYRRGGNRDYSLKHYDAGGYFNISEPHLLAMQKAFQSIHIEPSGGTDPDIPDNVMMIYFGPERENEAEPTDLTKSTEWVLGKRIGSFPGKRNTILCRWFGLLCG